MNRRAIIHTDDGDHIIPIGVVQIQETSFYKIIKLFCKEKPVVSRDVTIDFDGNAMRFSAHQCYFEEVGDGYILYLEAAQEIVPEPLKTIGPGPVDPMVKENLAEIKNDLLHVTSKSLGEWWDPCCICGEPSTKIKGIIHGEHATLYLVCDEHELEDLTDAEAYKTMPFAGETP